MELVVNNSLWNKLTLFKTFSLAARMKMILGVLMKVGMERMLSYLSMRRQNSVRSIPGATTKYLELMMKQTMTLRIDLESES